MNTGAGTGRSTGSGTGSGSGTARGGWELPIGEDQLDRLTRETVEAHRETLPAMRASAAELAERFRAGRTEREVPADAGRRRFLRGAGGAGAAFALAACSGGRNGAPPSGSAAAPVADTATYPGDLRTVALAAALENQAVETYRTALAAAGAGRLGSVPPAVSAFVTTAMAQHTDHAKAWNAVLAGADRPAVTGVPLSDREEVATALRKARSVGDVAALALQLEDQAARTYLLSTYSVRNEAVTGTAATIAPVEAMHAAVLRFVLGQYPVPDAFLPVAGAARPSLLTG
ncbi:ferritin-like domain-containing protein [Streptomyces sp. JV176]|uniref:ferritin-like domain-containing protein n=1 Tax=Streptomyces sp. JV176 TaxID=858630 RepID=UPI002E78F208|nr:ferritin-like domain-containing protein [Streptomyces sp. JV176]MEE1799302.1 ferritin-like domain-containing protein [Streptomyces sp. JV176]